MKSMFRKGERGTLVVPPSYEVLICGCREAFVAGSRVRLTYTDESVEEADLGEPVPLPCENFFSLVSAVQAKRKAVVA